MKLNNKGFGMRETLIYLSILLMVLLIASCSISSFYDDLEESKNEEYVPSYGYDVEDDNDVVSDDEEDIVINYTPYYLAEARFREAAENYANAYSLRDSLTTLKLEDVDKSGYLDETIVDDVVLSLLLVSSFELEVLDILTLLLLDELKELLFSPLHDTNNKDKNNILIFFIFFPPYIKIICFFIKKHK